MTWDEQRLQFAREDRERQAENERRSEEPWRTLKASNPVLVREVEQGGGGGGLILVGLFALSRRLRKGLGVVVLILIGIRALAGLMAAGDPSGSAGSFAAVVLVLAGVLGLLWAIASSIAFVIRIAAEDIRDELERL
jgi:hypothetical protein